MALRRLLFTSPDYSQPNENAKGEGCADSDNQDSAVVREHRLAAPADQS